MDFADNPLLIKCFLHLPLNKMKVINFLRQQKFPDQYFNKVLDYKEIICYTAPGEGRNTQWKFALINSMIWLTILWFHAIFGHSGSHRMHETLQAQYHHPHLQMHIECFTCNKCQCAKPSGPGHGLLPNCDMAGAPWEEVAVDLIEPWPGSTLHSTVESFALMCIDRTTNLVKIACIFEKSSNHVATCFKHTWLSWYPKPM